RRTRPLSSDLPRPCRGAGGSDPAIPCDGGGGTDRRAASGREAPRPRVDRVWRPGAGGPAGAGASIHRPARLYRVSSMSGLLATFGTDTDRHTAPFGAALSRLARLGGDHEQLWREEDSALFVTRKAWQLTPDFSGPVLVLEDRELVVAADASLYGTHDLRAALRARGLASGDSPSHLIAAAYRAWGDDLVEHVNGDSAFVIWDRGGRRVLAAREQAGQRWLCWAWWGSGLALSSSSRSLAELPGRST